MDGLESSAAAGQNPALTRPARRGERFILFTIRANEPRCSAAVEIFDHNIFASGYCLRRFSIGLDADEPRYLFMTASVESKMIRLLRFPTVRALPAKGELLLVRSGSRSN